jgi:hypothetical protein
MKTAFRLRLIHLLLAATAIPLSVLLPGREVWAQG